MNKVAGVLGKAKKTGEKAGVNLMDLDSEG